MSTLTADERITELVDILRGHDEPGEPPGFAGVAAASEIAQLPRYDLLLMLGAALSQLAAQREPAETPRTPDVDITATPDDAFPTYTTEQIEALDRLASVMRGPHWRIDLWTPAGVLHAQPARPDTKETDQ